MVVPFIPSWLGSIVCLLILAFNIIAVIKAVAASEIVGGIDEKIKRQTFLIKSLTADAQVLMSSAKSEVIREETKRVYEAIRYSDPMSMQALAEVEEQIQKQFTAFTDVVRAGDTEVAKEAADVLLELLESRNQKCRLLK